MLLFCYGFKRKRTCFEFTHCGGPTKDFRFTVSFVHCNGCSYFTKANWSCLAREFNMEDVHVALIFHKLSRPYRSHNFKEGGYFQYCEV